MDVTQLVRRTAAVGAGTSGVLHLLMLGHGSDIRWSMVMTTLAIVCLPCAGHLWRTASPRSWTLIGLMNAGMLGVHLWLLGSAPGSAAGPAALESAGAQGHSHADATLSLSGLHQLLMPLASGVAALEILLAGVGLYLLPRVVHATRVQAQHSLLQAKSIP